MKGSFGGLFEGFLGYRDTYQNDDLCRGGLMDVHA